MIINVVLTIASIIIIYTDFKYQIISNKITLPLILFGVIFNSVQHGLPGFIASILGILLGYLIYVIPFSKGWMGGGDVKFAMAIGSMVGYQMLIISLGMASILGMIFVLIVMAKNKCLWSKLKNILTSLFWFIGTKGKVKLFAIENQKHKVPYGIFLSIGTISTILLKGVF